MGEHPARFAITSERPLSPQERTGLAALLLRTRLSLELIPVGEAHAFLHLRQGESLPLDTPAALLDTLQTWLRKLEQSSDNSLPIALLRLVSLILEGGLEAKADLDTHGRPDPSQCPHVQENQLAAPLLDQLGIALRKILIRLCGLESLSIRKPIAVFSFDIDSSGYYQKENLPGTIRRNLTRPVALLRGAMAKVDPVIDFSSILQPVLETKIPATIFVQTHRWHRLDNYSLAKAKALRDALRAILAENPQIRIGLHSSYQSLSKPEELYQRQWTRLRRVFGSSLEPAHRAHFLRAPLQLEKVEGPAGMPVADSSLAFGSRNGFRRLTSLPFRAGSLFELPFCAMDSTAIFWARQTPQEFLEECRGLLDKVTAVGGCFVVNFHPHLLTKIFHPGCGAVLAELIESCRAHRCEFQSLATAAANYEAELHEIEDSLERLFP